ncbi:MAG TPA: c-type cytochrome domain-containing protein, partial [Gemmataceae bacterium]|nr:c-type cytochrome domain-containing protein [Gemmataceae bacterium]
RMRFPMLASQLRTILALISLFFVSPLSMAADAPTYWQDVRPILRRHCTVCHSVRNLKEVDVSGGFTLETYEAVLKNPKKQLLQPGKSADSLLLQLVSTDNTEKRMPLGANPLPKDAIELLRRWIDAGAKEGVRPETEATTTAPTTVTRTRKLDVTLTTTLTPPAGVFGDVPPAPLQLALKIGPLAPITAVAFSPDGKLLATGAYGRVTVWELPAAKPIKVLTNVLGAVNDLRFSPEGKLLAAAGGQPSAKGDLRLYEVADWKLLATLGGHDDVVSSVAFSPDGKHLASASFDKTVRLWDVPTHKQERLLTGHSDFVYAVAFAPDGTWLASASKDRTVRIVETATGQGRLTLSGMEQDVLAVAISPDGGSVVSAGYEPGLLWWNARTGERGKPQGGHSIAVHEICFSKDGKVVASAGADGTVRLWKGAGGAALRSLTIGSSVYAVALSPDGKLVASGSFDGLVRLFDVASGKQLVTLLALPPQGDDAEWLALTPQGHATASVRLTTKGQWRMGGRNVPAEAVWKTLAHPEEVERAVRGEAVAAPAFGK